MADNDGSSISSCESSDGSWTPSIGSGEDSDDDKASRPQCVIPESGPPVVLRATRAVGGRTAFFVAYRNGTGRVTFLQSTRPEFSTENIEYMSVSWDQLYSKHFQAMLKLKRSAREGDAYMGEPLGRKESSLRAKRLREETRAQGSMCW
jgi:hypothetical protein